MRASAHPDFVALAREAGVAVIVAGDSEYPQIADVTAPFVYARIMGTQEEAAEGYSGEALERWAGRVRRWAAGEEAGDRKRWRGRPRRWSGTSIAT